MTGFQRAPPCHAAGLRRAAVQRHVGTGVLNGDVVEIGFVGGCADREWLAFVAGAQALCSEDALVGC